MPTVSIATAPRRLEEGPVHERADVLDGYDTGFVKFHQTIDSAPMFTELPDGRCQCPHWGYVFAGRMTVRYADHDEVIQAGDAYYMPPGHVPVMEEGCEFLMFSPEDLLAPTNEAIQRAMAAAQH
jgi:hypothetical protein